MEPVHRGRGARRLRGPRPRGYPRAGPSPAEALTRAGRTARGAGPHQALRWLHGAERGEHRGEARRAVRPDRAQRIRQDHADQLRVGRAPGGRRAHPLRRPGDHRSARPPADPPRPGA